MSHKQLLTDVEAFLAKGGKITALPTEARQHRFDCETVQANGKRVTRYKNPATRRFFQSTDYLRTKP